MTDGVLPPALPTGHWTQARIIAPPELALDVRPEPTGGYLAICLIVKVRLMMCQGTGGGLPLDACVKDIRRAPACCPSMKCLLHTNCTFMAGALPRCRAVPASRSGHMLEFVREACKAAQSLQQQLELPWHGAAL